MSAAWAVATLVKRIYDLLVAYLVFWVVAFALLAWGLFLGSELVAEAAGFSDQDLMWVWIGRRVGFNGTQARLATFAPIHGAVMLLLWRPLAWLRDQIGEWIDQFTAGLERATSGTPHCIVVAEAAFSLAITAAMIPFVIQPTMVPLSVTQEAWAERLTHLVDGSASAAFAESMVGMGRRLWAPDQASVRAGTSLDFASSEGLMDRWDPLIWDAVDGDPHRFAQVKAVVWVESAGRQFAVSHTGCLGLMQFCVGTARRAPFQQIFGTGTVFPCGCPPGGCQVSAGMKEALETADQGAVEAGRASFPCDLSDARFDPERSIGSGARYLSDLSDELGDNLLLMYVGYNSGPSIARRVFADLGGDGAASVEDIEVHLEGQLRPYYRSAEARAKGLTGTHLPKLNAAYLRYRDQAGSGPPAG